MEMDGLSLGLLSAAAGVAVTHTLLGPDHYLPFLMLARARRWSRPRAVFVSVLCGTGHVLSSIALGTLGILLGLAVGRLEQAERARGDLAAWALVAFGAAYALWGARRALREAGGLRVHEHGERVHLHAFAHEGHEHPSGGCREIAEPGREGRRSTTGFWTLFIIFILGPCEPLIPLFIVPASRGRWVLAGFTAAIFGILTVACMAFLTYAGVSGLRRLPFGPLEKWADSLAGAAIAASGLLIVTIGL
jgi:nickel/cobalt transporter (NicO) family protein